MEDEDPTREKRGENVAGARAGQKKKKKKEYDQPLRRDPVRRRPGTVGTYIQESLARPGLEDRLFKG